MNDAPDNGITNELTALRRRVEELEAEAAQFARQDPEQLCSAVFEAIGDPAVLVDLDHRIIGINSALRTWCEQLGLETDVAGRDLCEAYPFLPNTVREDHDRLLQTGQSRVSEATVDVDGHRITYEVHKSPVVVDSRITRVLHVIRNITERRQAEEALRESEQQYRSLFEDVPVGIYRTSPDGRILAANPALLEMLGFASSEELSRRNLEETGFGPGHPRSRFKELIERQGQVKGFESIWVRRDGTMLSVREAATAVRDADGALLYYEGIVEDITERKQAENDLRESEERLRAILSSLHETGIAVYDREGAFLAVWGNAALSERFGITAEQLQSKSVRDVYPPDQAEWRIGRIREVFETGNSLFDEYAIDLPGGTFWLEVTLSPMRDAEGNVSAVVGFDGDATRRKQAAEALQTERDHSARIIANTPAIICSIAPDGTTLSVNPAGEHVTGYSADEIVGANWWDMFYPGREHSQVDRLYRDFEHGDVRDYEMTLTTRSGEKRIVSWNSINRFDAEGRLVEIVGFGNDVTGRKQAERDLRIAHEKLIIAREQERRRLASELHDSVSQNLVAVQLAIQDAAAAGGGKPDAEQNRLLIAAAEQCTELVREVRGICYGLYPPALHTLGLVAALRQLGRYCHDHVEFCLVCPADIENQRFDEAREIALYRIAQEAVNNALRHADARRIEVRLARDTDEIALEITDDGCGFDLAGCTGAGLGLTTMSDRAKAAGGELTIRSEPGRTRVKVCIPLSPPAE